MVGADQQRGRRTRVGPSGEGSQKAGSLVRRSRRTGTRRRSVRRRSARRRSARRRSARRGSGTRPSGRRRRSGARSLVGRRSGLRGCRGRRGRLLATAIARLKRRGLFAIQLPVARARRDRTVSPFAFAEMTRWHANGPPVDTHGLANSRPPGPSQRPNRKRCATCEACRPPPGERAPQVPNR